jgi:predicted DNA-binding protein
MNVKLKLETERRLAELATQTGRAPGQVLEDMIEGYFEEADALRAMSTVGTMTPSAAVSNLWALMRFGL